MTLVCCNKCKELVEEYNAKLVLEYNHPLNKERRNIWLCKKCHSNFRTLLDRVLDKMKIETLEEYNKLFVKFLFSFSDSNPSFRLSDF